MTKIRLPEHVKKIISQLEAHGYEAYAVGGCVRDSLLKKEPKDWDVTTSARPEAVKEIFPRCIDTGIKHGTVTVMFERRGYEVTTFRIDGDYSDGRHPDHVEFTPELSEDLKRRDFTINAMAYSKRTGVVDLYGGEKDLANGLIRAVGEAEERFSEDALRILRLVRFSAALGFAIEEKTFEAAKKLSGNLQRVSAERIREEFMKTLLSPHPEKILLLEEIGALKVFFPELSAMLGGGASEGGSPASVAASESGASGDDAVVRVKTVSRLPEDKILRLAELFDVIRRASCLDSDEIRSLTDNRLRALKFDNETREQVVFLMKYAAIALPSEADALRRTLSLVGKKDFPLLLSFRALHACDEPQTDFAAVSQAFAGILERGECTSVQELAVTGNDLIALGMKPGKTLGETLQALLSKVLDDPSLNEKEKLLALLKEGGTI
ncbi:MAG: polynucleotide adenylyltransferase [Lachnospiraceae bacterium]|nr:polynucleotide adenylyltransferase [Lachnospiraceae bacterium]